MMNLSSIWNSSIFVSFLQSTIYVDMRLSSLLLAFFGFSTICLLGYMTYTKSFGSTLFYLLFICVVGLVAAYMMSPQLDWWWFKRTPPPMHRGVEKQMRVMVPFYDKLDSVEKKRFRDRVMLTMEAKEFIPVVFETLPEDVKTIIAAQIVMMTFGMEKYLLHPYERVVVYPHAFPSPNYKFLHSSEINHEDGCVIFDAERMMLGVGNPSRYYNLILHEYAHAFLKIYPEYDFPIFNKESYPKLKEIRGLDFEFICKYVGMKEVDVRQVVVEHFFVTPKRFKHFLPEVYEQMTRIFNIDPTLGERPVLEILKIGENPLLGQ